MSEVQSHTSESTNHLGSASSAYLLSARHQPVHWHEWTPAAFALAAAQDKPILLDVGATWCHWCHVMDRESYENPAVAAIINLHFIAIKVDRDERPEIDTRYQSAIAAISGQGGWPLTVFLTPSGRPFFGGTYFPPDDRHGRPSLQRVLLTMADAFRHRRDEVEESAASVLEAVEQNETLIGEPTVVTPAIVLSLLRSTLQQFDARSGGFGSQPKFPHAPALDLLLTAAAAPASLIPPDLAAQAANAARFTLEQMAAGGVYDHLAGGFHRYAVDERWIVPHFEKMSYDNSELLRAYLHGWQHFREPHFAEVAHEILHWLRNTLADPVDGGFFASQDADRALDDDGDYFTWTRDEVAHVLSGPERALAHAFFDINEVGDMHHSPARNVLRTPLSLASAATSAGLSADEAKALLPVVRRKLLTARDARPTPFIDRTLYTVWNGLCVSAFLQAARLFNDPDLRRFALLSLDRILQAALTSEGRVLHVASPPGTPPSLVQGTLDDYTALGLAVLDAWTSTADPRFLRATETIVRSLLRLFHDPEAGGFFDTEVLPAEPVFGILVARRKPLQDATSPAGNSAAATLLIRAGRLLDHPEWISVGRQTLETFAGIVEHFGLYSASFALAADRLLTQPVILTILADGEAATPFLQAAADAPSTAELLVLNSAALPALPPSISQTASALAQAAQGRAVAQVCVGTRCLHPVFSAQDLSSQLQSLRQP